ncbi:MAG: hypothetical protein RIE24_27345 [Silicimonas sp.]
MGFDLIHALVPAAVIVVVVLVLEEWAYFKSRSAMARALITAAAVFALLLVINFFWPTPGY